MRSAGGWLVWQAVREGKPWWWALCGSIVLIGYGFIPTLQPLNDFGRLYAVYGGIFIGMSFGWAKVFDGTHQFVFGHGTTHVPCSAPTQVCRLTKATSLGVLFLGQGSC